MNFDDLGEGSESDLGTVPPRERAELAILTEEGPGSSMPEGTPLSADSGLAPPTHSQNTGDPADSP